jgi:predicted DNA-binding protein (MmcQ/YjbR family)
VTRDQVLDLCASLPGAVEDYPFGDDVAVFNVAGKMFALVSLAGEPGSVNLKCDPDWALELGPCTRLFALATTRASATGTPSNSTAPSKTPTFER